MANNWDIYSRQGLDLALSVSTVGFSAARFSTHLGVRLIATFPDNILTSSCSFLSQEGLPHQQSELQQLFSIMQSLEDAQSLAQLEARSWPPS